MLVGCGSILFIGELNYHSKSVPAKLGLLSWNLINTRCGHLKISEAKLSVRTISPPRPERGFRVWSTERIKHLRSQTWPRKSRGHSRFDTCLHKIITASASVRKKIFWNTVPCGLAILVIVVTRTFCVRMKPRLQVAEISPKTFLLLVSFVFTLNQFKGGARNIDVTLWRLKRRTWVTLRWPPL